MNAKDEKRISRFPFAVSRLLFAVFSFTLLLTACGEPEPITAPPTAGSDWWREAVFYEIFVRSYRDSDRDGMGDLQGVIEKLDYLNDGDPATDTDLGVTAVWLMPITEAASYHGYDTLDYTAIEADYGTEADFRRLIDAAHERGIRVIVDLVLNHTSSLHPWFVDARTGPDSDKWDWYVWIDENPAYFGPWGQTVWHQNGRFHYFGLFTPEMPDLNYTNPDVTAEMYAVTRFWLEEMSVDGFRLDATRHLIEDGEQMSNTTATRDWLIAYRDFVHGINPDAVLVGEIWDETVRVAPYIDAGAVDLAFEFNLAELLLLSLNQTNPASFRGQLAEVLAGYPGGQYATFLTNHDMDRLMSQLDEDPTRARLAATTLFTIPGVPFIYYGEEIGMTGARGALQPRDENVRTPMQWEPVENAGFTDALPWLRVNQGYLGQNVIVQDAAPDSLLTHYRQLIRLRQTHPALARGGAVLLESSCDRMLGYLRATADEQILVLHNFADDPVRDCAFTLPASDIAAGVYETAVLFGDAAAGQITVDKDGRFQDVQLTPNGEHAPFTTLILQLQPGS